MFFICFQVKAKIIDFVKTSVVPEENHVFWSSEFLWGNAFLNSQTFEKIRFGRQKTLQNGGQNPLKSMQIFISKFMLNVLRFLRSKTNEGWVFLEGGVHPTSKDGSPRGLGSGS